MRARRPTASCRQWIPSTPNEPVLTHCLQVLSGHTGATARAICVGGGSASGGSALLHQIARQARGLGKRVLFLDDHLFPGNRYLLTKLMHTLGVGTLHVPDSYDGLSSLCVGIMDLRGYDVVIIDDVQKYTDVSPRVTDCNTKSLLGIARLRQPPLIIIAGFVEPATLYHSHFVDAQVVSELLMLRRMPLDDQYVRFVARLCELGAYGDGFPTTIDINQVYHDSQGRVGWTVRRIEWLYLIHAAELQARKQPVYHEWIAAQDDDPELDELNSDLDVDYRWLDDE